LFALYSDIIMLRVNSSILVVVDEFISDCIVLCIIHYVFLLKKLLYNNKVVLFGPKLNHH